MKTVKLILFLMGMVLISCGDDDNTSYAPGDNTDTPTSQDFAPTSLVGKIITFDEYLANGGGSTGNDNRIQFYT